MKAVKPTATEGASYRVYQVGKLLAQKRDFTVALWAVYADQKEAADAMVALGRDMMAVVDALP